MIRTSPARRALAAGAVCLASAGLGACTAVAADVGYVASLVGDAQIEVERARSELAFLDLLPDGSRLHLETGSELRVCHGGAGFVSGVAGPAVVRVTSRELIAESGAPPVRTGERCNAPLVSKVQGGAAFRSVGGQPMPVGVRSWLRIVAAPATTVSKATLLAPDGTTRMAEFQAVSLSPVVLSDGSTYSLVVAFTDGRSVTVRLAARDNVAAEVAVITVTP